MRYDYELLCSKLASVLLSKKINVISRQNMPPVQNRIKFTIKMLFFTVNVELSHNALDSDFSIGFQWFFLLDGYAYM